MSIPSLCHNGPSRHHPLALLFDPKDLPLDPAFRRVFGLGNLVNPFNTGVAVNYGMVQPKTNAFAVSPFTPQGFTSPNFTPASGGSIYAYQTSAPGVGTYINSAGNTMHYNVNADQRVYGNYSGGFGGFQP